MKKGIEQRESVAAVREARHRTVHPQCKTGPWGHLCLVGLGVGAGRDGCVLLYGAVVILWSLNEIFLSSYIEFNGIKVLRGQDRTTGACMWWSLY